MVCYHHFNLAMGRSQGFASSSTDLFALLRLAFAAANGPEVLNLASKD